MYDQSLTCTPSPQSHFQISLIFLTSPTDVNLRARSGTAMSMSLWHGYLQESADSTRLRDSWEDQISTSKVVTHLNPLFSEMHIVPTKNWIVAGRHMHTKEPFSGQSHCRNTKMREFVEALGNQGWKPRLNAVPSHCMNSSQASSHRMHKHNIPETGWDRKSSSSSGYYNGSSIVKFGGGGGRDLVAASGKVKSGRGGEGVVSDVCATSHHMAAKATEKDPEMLKARNSTL